MGVEGMRSRVLIPLLILFTLAAASQENSGLALNLPLKSKSVRFAVIGDSGTGDDAQFGVAREMETYRQVVGFTFVIMLGDNIYGGDNPQDFVRNLNNLTNPCSTPE
jgi:hypothetical protein